MRLGGGRGIGGGISLGSLGGSIGFRSCGRGATTGLANDVFVGAADGIAQAAAGAHFAHHRVARQRAGDFAEFVAAHSVSDQPQAEIGVGIIGVLVELAAQTDVARVSEFNHRCGQSCRGTE